MAKAYLIHGYIGVGKSTFSKKLEKELPAIRFTHDEWMSTLYGHNPPADEFSKNYNNVLVLINSLWPKCLALGMNVILDLNFWSRKQRDETRSIITGLGKEFILYSIDCSENTVKKRLEQRNQSLEKNLFISENTYSYLKNQFEPLGNDEIHKLICNP